MTWVITSLCRDCLDVSCVEGSDHEALGGRLDQPVGLHAMQGVSDRCPGGAQLGGQAVHYETVPGNQATVQDRRQDPFVGQLGQAAVSRTDGWQGRRTPQRTIQH